MIIRNELGLERTFHPKSLKLRGGGGAVARLVEALRYKPEGREFDSDGVIGIFSLT